MDIRTAFLKVLLKLRGAAFFCVVLGVGKAAQFVGELVGVAEP